MSAHRTHGMSVTGKNLAAGLPILAILAGVSGCAHRAGSAVDSHPAMAAAAGVVRADAGKGPHDFRLIPLKSMSGDVEILYGDPETPGEPFVMRIRELPGAIVPPHSHPVDENITVVEGTWYFALGDEFKYEALQELKSGTYAFAPKGSSMFGFSPGGAIVQIHGVGPFRIHWHGGLHTLDDPDAASVFHFARGTRVLFQGRGARITEGYASGRILQYEIEEDNGQHRMASESDLREGP
jgi:quercetin dioxygenase-like cupin family protein